MVGAMMDPQADYQGRGQNVAKATGDRRSCLVRCARRKHFNPPYYERDLACEELKSFPIIIWRLLERAVLWFVAGCFKLIMQSRSTERTNNLSQRPTYSCRNYFFSFISTSSTFLWPVHMFAEQTYFLFALFRLLYSKRVCNATFIADSNLGYAESQHIFTVVWKCVSAATCNKDHGKILPWNTWKSLLQTCTQNQLNRV
jgi:hypothetical protein